MSPAHPLDRPVWSALTTRQAHLALGDARAWRIDPDFGPFAAAADGSADCAAALGALGLATRSLAVVETAPAAPAPGLRRISAAVCNQMLLGELTESARDDALAGRIERLGPADHEEMQALVRLTRPGPFGPRTPELGAFFGIRIDGRLAAMAGERMQPTGFTEVSGVCTHPGHRGAGYGAILSRHVARRIAARGEQAFLHVYDTNVGAISVYEALGFRLRRQLWITVMAI